MTVAAECYFPPQIIKYPDSDGKLMAEGDIQRDVTSISTRSNDQGAKKDIYAF